MRKNTNNYYNTYRNSASKTTESKSDTKEKNQTNKDSKEVELTKEQRAKIIEGIRTVDQSMYFLKLSMLVFLGSYYIAIEDRKALCCQLEKNKASCDKVDVCHIRLTTNVMSVASSIFFAVLNNKQFQAQPNTIYYRSDIATKLILVATLLGFVNVYDECILGIEPTQPELRSPLTGELYPIPRESVTIIPESGALYQ